MTLPNAILAGAQKSGTTALCRFLQEHPQCLVSEPKEPNFFSRAANLSHLDRYERCFRTAQPTHRIFIDGTTTYMADPTIAPRIRMFLGEVKIIFILRNPTARTYSSFLHMLKRGHERRSSDKIFLNLPDNPESAAAMERSAVQTAAARGHVIVRPYRRLYDDVLWNYRYVGNSIYSSLVQSFFSVFERENILILFFEDITRDVTAAREALGAFLNIDPGLFPGKVARGNKTDVPIISNPLGWLIEQSRRIKRNNFTLVRPSEIAASPLTPSRQVVEKLGRIFSKEVEHWSQWTGRDLHAIGW